MRRWKREDNQEQGRQLRAFVRKAGVVFENFLGILLAFGIALGGLFLVQRQLVQEEERLLHGSGMVEIQVQSETAAMPEEAWTEQAQMLLTDAQLYRVVKKWEKEVEAYPHEPWEGQMSMAEAVECGREWIEGFLLPHLGIHDMKLSEYNINCYLWAWQTDVEAGDRDPILSYWYMWFDIPGLSIDMTLNAATGQVLAATVSCSSVLVEYRDQDKDQVAELLHAYADSFGLEGRYAIYDAGDRNAVNGWMMYEGIGEEGVYAAVRTSAVVIATADEAYGEYTEIFHVELRLGTDD